MMVLSLEHLALPEVANRNGKPLPMLLPTIHSLKHNAAGMRHSHASTKVVPTGFSSFMACNIDHELQIMLMVHAISYTSSLSFRPAASSALLCLAVLTILCSASILMCSITSLPRSLFPLFCFCKQCLNLRLHSVQLPFECCSCLFTFG
jgi:hypothetical protein